MKLYIAEKPSLGRAIADALPKPHKKQHLPRRYEEQFLHDQRVMELHHVQKKD